MTDITMPRLSDSMEAGTVLRWLKAAGEAVRAGEELVEIETDKATMTYESPAAGTLDGPVPEGDSYPVGAVIATLGAADPSAGEAVTRDEDPAEAAPTAATAEPPPEAPVTQGVAAGSPHPAPASAGTPRSTPLARRIAAAHGIELSSLGGTGPRGRITRSDVATAAGLPPAARPEPTATPTSPERNGAPAPDPAPPASPAPGRTVRPLSRTQQVIARRMAESKATVPHFQVQTDATLDALLELRGRLKALTDRPPSINDFIVKASAIALREFPLANGSYRDGRFELHERVNVGIAVATEDALIVPTVTDADQRSLGAIAAEARRLAGAVRDGSITPAELSGATFTVSNLGMYGMTAITPVVNVPQAAILGVGTTREVLARVEGEIVERRQMTLTLSCDHRILYGANAAQFLSRIRELLEAPLRLAL